MSVYEDIEALIREVDGFEDEQVYRDGLPDKPIDAICALIYSGSIARTHGSDSVWVRHGLDLRVRSTSPQEARRRMDALFAKLNNSTNRYIESTGGHIQFIFAISNPILVSRQSDNRVVYSCSFTVSRRS